MENLTVKLEGNTPNEIVWREGKAAEQLPLKEPKIINISGDIGSISSFIKTRSTDAAGSQVLDKSKLIVVVDKKARTIAISLDPENHYGATITGRLEASDELGPFNINKEVTFSRESLLKLVRFSRLFFDDKSVHQTIVDNLSKITMKSETEMQAANDRKGNKSSAIEQKVNMPDKWVGEFYLLIPLFKGFEAEKIRVEICIDVTATGFCFWLESPELAEATESKVGDIFKKELASCDGYVIINK